MRLRLIKQPLKSKARIEAPDHHLAIIIAACVEDDVEVEILVDFTIAILLLLVFHELFGSAEEAGN